jgi:flagellar hook assembly protein FlgD
MSAQTVFVLPVNIEDIVNSGFTGLHIYPNPFTEKVKISFSLINSVDVKLEVYNVLGQSIQVLEDKKINSGEHEYTFDANGLPAGVYNVRITTPDKSETIRVMNIKK